MSSRWSWRRRFWIQPLRCERLDPDAAFVFSAASLNTRIPRELGAWSGDLAAACGSGLLLLLSFPRFDLGVCAWSGLVPLLLVLKGRPPFHSFLLGAVMAWVLFTGVFYWIWTVPAFNLLDYLLLASYLALYGGLFGLSVAWMHGRGGWPLSLIAPPLWVALEYLRAHASFLGVPWMLLGHSQYRHPWLIQICSFTGVYGVSFLIVLVNAASADTLIALRARELRAPCREMVLSVRPLSLVVALSLLGLSALYGAWALSPSERMAPESLSVAVVQGNIPQHRKWDQAYRDTILARHKLLSREAAVHHPTLIVWPETAVPGDVQHAPALLERVGQVARETNSYLLVGSATSAKFSDKSLSGKNYNSMVLISPEGRVAGEYKKMVLVPFGEYAPLRGIIAWSEAVATPRRDIVAGDQFTLFTVGGVAFGATICWESLFPDHFRELVKRGARFMVNAGNEAWFGESAASAQFLAMTTFRAVENRVAIARATNTGISAFIDPSGRITARLTGQDGKDVFTEGVLTADVPLAVGQTFYTLHGDVFAVLQIIGCASMFVLALRTRLVHDPVPCPARPLEGERA